MARPKPSLRQTKIFLNRLMLGLVSLLGFLSATSILTAPSSLSTSDASLEVSSAGRNPSSFGRGLHESIPDRPKIQVVKINCDEEMTFDENAQQIRLKGKICSSKGVSIEKSSVKNAENEDVATVFHKDKDYTTDVIHLRPGANKLIITNYLSDGTSNTQVLHVNRGPAAKN